MPLKTFSLLLAAVGIGTTLYQLGRRMPLGTGAPSTGPAAASAVDQGEQLQGLKLASADTNTATPGHDDLLTPPPGEEQQLDEVKPGLPDFWRGA